MYNSGSGGVRYTNTWDDKWALCGWRLWLFTKIVKWAVRQSGEHQTNITMMYGIILDRSRREFYEDNNITLQSFLDECYDETRLECD